MIFLLFNVHNIDFSSIIKTKLITVRTHAHTQGHYGTIWHNMEQYTSFIFLK